MKLDLHSVKHDDVPREVIRFIEENLYSEQDLEIVTGNSFKMQEIVVDILDEYMLEYRIGGWLGFNKGFIKIYMGA